MMTRDSHGWWFVMGGALIVALSSRLDLIDPLLPAQHQASVHAVIELLAFLSATGAGVMRMSPLAISDEGRATAIAKKVESAETAAVAAGVAAGAADTAAKAADVAVKAATVASVESTKAADTVDE